MNKFTETIKNPSHADTTTTNGMEAHSSTGSTLVDLFSSIAASRGNSVIVDTFAKALAADRVLAAKILLWSRDVREGAGERKVPRDLLKYLEKRDPDLLVRLLPKLPELGRFDDLLIFNEPKVKEVAFGIFAKSLNEGSGLAAKWAPREKSANKKIAQELMQYMRLSPKQYRQKIVEATNVVENKMCSNSWSDINFSHVPSVAHSRYKKAFCKRAPVEYSAYISALTNGDPSVKINAGAIFPHDVIKGVMIRRASSKEQEVTNAQWAALPNYMGDGHKALALVDVSGSMTCSVGGLSGVSCLQVAVSLGLYVSDKNSGAFKDIFLTFTDKPEFVHLTGDISSKVEQMTSSDWGMSTNLEAAFNRILRHAVENEVPVEDMPSTLLIMSDMQFNACVKGQTASSMIKEKYKAAGYQIPNVVFWNLKDYSNRPAKSSTPGVALVSGFSPSILKTVLGRNIVSPYQTMLDTVDVPRYEF